MDCIKKDSYVNAVKVDVALISGLMRNFVFNCEEVHSAQDILMHCTGQSVAQIIPVYSVPLLS